MGLPLRRKMKKRLPARVMEPLEVPTAFTKTWSIDFVNDVLSNGTKFRSFNVIDCMSSKKVDSLVVEGFVV